MSQLYIGVWNHKDQFGNFSENGGIFFDRNSKIMFNLQILNASRSELSDKQVHVFPRELEKISFQDNFYDDNETRRETLKNFIEGKIFIFKVSEEQQDNPYAYDIKMHIKNNDFHNDDKFEEIPILMDSENNYETIKNKLIKGETIRSRAVSMISDKLDSISSFMITKSSHDENWILFENVTALSTDGMESIQYQKPSENFPITVRRIVDDTAMDGYYYDNGDDRNINHNIMFVPTRYLRENDSQLEKFTKIVTRRLGLTENDNEGIDESSQDVDLLFLKQFHEVIKSSEYQLLLNEDDIIKLHTSIKSSLLTILAGLSGTGKSKIIKAYAEALGILNGDLGKGQPNDIPEERFKFISVKPSWQDDSDLLGFADTISNNFRPGDSGIVDTLIDAKNNPRFIYIIVLDEMNLSRVEYYFSQFLSVLERSSSERYLTLYSKYLETRLYNSDKYSSKILIPENVRFIGTMNIDESTFELSDKLLDRTNIIELHTVPFYNKKDISHKSMKDVKSTNTWHNFEVGLLNYSSNGGSLTEEQLQFLWELHSEINDELPNVGISWRTIRSIDAYINKVPSTYANDIGKILDWQLSTRILTKLRGTESMLNSLISYDEKEKKPKGKIINILDKYSTLSDFQESRKKLLIKSKELKVNGFAR
ncbi:hypothetical protein N4599_09145 [Limosilactobacillus oris]|uniref:McrB family protein n=1 Tax=Limosilactobacillus oris TaxID=1632 RepID=UPI0021B3F70F|nr:hypothetical protein [Limosilactobacillus oris]UXC67253.1 hypothetical protein N4599_09145 [Limosilactobacillus oris]